MTTTTLRCTTRDDVLGVPELMLGFAPTESLTLLHIMYNRVEFCLRIDAEAAIDDPVFILERIESASAGTRRAGGEWMIIGFTSQPRSLANSIHYVISLLPSAFDAFVTDGTHSWRIDDDGYLVDEEQCDPSSRSSAALAVLDGQELGMARESIASQIPEWEPDVESGAWVRFVMEEFTADERMLWLEELMAEPDVSKVETAILGWLLADDECAVELARSTKTWNAEHRLRMLLPMLERVPEEARANAVGVTALASWVANEGVITTELLGLLEDIAPVHPLLRILGPMMQYAIPPSSWDEL